MDGLDGTGLQLDGLDWFKTFIGDQKLKKILYRQLEKVIFPAVTMRPILTVCLALFGGKEYSGN